MSVKLFAGRDFEKSRFFKLQKSFVNIGKKSLLSYLLVLFFRHTHITLCLIFPGCSYFWLSERDC